MYGDIYYRVIIYVLLCYHIIITIITMYLSLLYGDQFSFDLLTFVHCRSDRCYQRLNLDNYKLVNGDDNSLAMVMIMIMIITTLIRRILAVFNVWTSTMIIWWYLAKIIDWNGNIFWYFLSTLIFMSIIDFFINLLIKISTSCSHKL